MKRQFIIGIKKKDNKYYTVITQPYEETIIEKFTKRINEMLNVRSQQLQIIADFCKIQHSATEFYSYDKSMLEAFISQVRAERVANFEYATSFGGYKIAIIPFKNLYKLIIIDGFYSIWWTEYDVTHLISRVKDTKDFYDIMKKTNCKVDYEDKNTAWQSLMAKKKKSLLLFIEQIKSIETLEQLDK